MSIATLLATSNIPAQAQENLIYVAVEPCRLADTRQTGGSIPANGTVDLVAYGDSTAISGQGGNPAGCAHPRTDSTPVAISANFTAVGNQASGNGNLVAYAFGDTAPTASLVNYKVGTNIANSSIISLCEGAGCTSDFTVKSNNAAVPAIVDVQGYFYPDTGTCPDDMVAAGSICVDKYEASLWTAATGGTQIQPNLVDGQWYPCLDDGSDCSDGAANPIYARSVEAVLPAARPSLYQAAVACANVGKRLPSAAEWQMAAAGTPADGTICNSPTGGGSLENAGARTSCVSNTGAFDMVGNLWEWTADMTATAFTNNTTDDANMITLGEAFGNSVTSPSTKAVFAPSSGPAATNDQIGFRCVR